MRILKLKKNKYGRIMPTNPDDVPLFMHLFEGYVEVYEDYFQRCKSVMELHGVGFSMEIE